MTWQQEAVIAWRDWAAGTRWRAQVIPVYEQVGKTLEFCLLDDKEALVFISLQISADKDDNFHSMNDGYWIQVRHKLQELQVNNMIMAE